MSTLSTPTLPADPRLDEEISDADFLGRFVSTQDEDAFAALVKRHGGLVRGVCRRILMDPAAADDAFQHTFLSLSQHAQFLVRALAPSASLASWLYRVAVNASLQLKRKARSRRRTETKFAEHRPSAQAPVEPWNEVLPALDEEISALPGQYRSAVVKCHLEGKTQQDAAKELGITYATLRRRLKEARGMLRNRLSQRGFVNNGFVLIPLLGQLGATESVSAETVSAVTQTVLSKSAVSAAAAGQTAAVVGGTAGGGWAAFGTKLLALNPLIKSALAGILMFGALGSWWLIRPDGPSEESAPSANVAESDSAAEAQNEPDRPEKDEADAQGHFAYVFRNGRVASPEFENAVQALDDSDPSEEPDRLVLPELENSKVMVWDVSQVSRPLPREMDVLDRPADLRENYLEWEVSEANLKLLQEVAARPEPTPLPVEEVIRALNEQQERRSQYSVAPAVPPASHFLGHHNIQPARTLKVIPLP